MNETNKPLWKTLNFWTIISLIFFAPVGIFLMWFYKKDWNKNLKIALTVLSVLFFVIGVSQPKTTTQTQEVKKEVKQEVKKEVPQKTEEEKAEEERIKKAEEERKKAEEEKKTPDVKIKDKFGNKVENVTFSNGLLKIDLKDNLGGWDQDHIVRSFPNTNFDMLWTGIFTTGVERVEVVGYTEFTDAKGNTKRERAITMTWNKDTVKDTTYENFKSIATLKPENIYNFSEAYNIHLGLYKDIKDETKNKIKAIKGI